MSQTTNQNPVSPAGGVASKFSALSSPKAAPEQTAEKPLSVVLGGGSDVHKSNVSPCPAPTSQQVPPKRASVEDIRKIQTRLDDAIKSTLQTSLPSSPFRRGGDAGRIPVDGDLMMIGPPPPVAGLPGTRTGSVDLITTHRIPTEFFTWLSFVGEMRGIMEAIREDVSLTVVDPSVEAGSASRSDIGGRVLAKLQDLELVVAGLQETLTCETENRMSVSACIVERESRTHDLEELVSEQRDVRIRLGDEVSRLRNETLSLRLDRDQLIGERFHLQEQLKLIKDTHQANLHNEDEVVRRITELTNKTAEALSEAEVAILDKQKVEAELRKTEALLVDSKLKLAIQSETSETFLKLVQYYEKHVEKCSPELLISLRDRERIEALQLAEEEMRFEEERRLRAQQENSRKKQSQLLNALRDLSLPAPKIPLLNRRPSQRAPPISFQFLNLDGVGEGFSDVDDEKVETTTTSSGNDPATAGSQPSPPYSSSGRSGGVSSSDQNDDTSSHQSVSINTSVSSASSPVDDPRDVGVVSPPMKTINRNSASLRSRNSGSLSRLLSRVGSNSRNVESCNNKQLVIPSIKGIGCTPADTQNSQLLSPEPQAPSSAHMLLRLASKTVEDLKNKWSRSYTRNSAVDDGASTSTKSSSYMNTKMLSPQQRVIYGSMGNTEEQYIACTARGDLRSSRIAASQFL